jgi:hypothetical protein
MYRTSLSGSTWCAGCLAIAWLAVLPPATLRAESPAKIRVSDDGTRLVVSDTGDRWIAWGVNYDHDRSGRLLDEYWIEHWDTVVEDFQEIKALGANCVRVHLQFGLFMDGPDEPNRRQLEQLVRLTELAEEIGLYLDVTGLACYHKANVPDWYDQLEEQARWDAQAVFWQAVAEVCRESSAVFCYDLMNEPILPGKEPAEEWLTGELSGKFFVQRIALQRRGRSRQQIAKTWVERMVSAIRRHDRETLITVGVIPWVFVFGGGQPLFHSEEVGEPLDFTAVHFYPKAGEIDRAVEALRAYEVGKPLVVEEIFPLKASPDEVTEFIERTRDLCDGWISFYWGTPPEQLEALEEPSMAEAITAEWLRRFRTLSRRVTSTPND